LLRTLTTSGVAKVRSNDFGGHPDVRRLPAAATHGSNGVLVTTWNVNSLRARMHRVEEFLDLYQPAVVLLQETKTGPDQFPHLELQAAGYTAIDNSGGQWAGVAALVRDGYDVGEVQVGLPRSPVATEARWVEVEVDGIRLVSVYVVNGRTVDDPMFVAKLDFLDAMADRLVDLRARGPVVLGGDINIAPADLDVWDPVAFVGRTHVTEDERGRLQAILGSGYVDAFRHLHDDEPGFTWWDYRAGAFHKGMGLRIDLFLVSDDLTDRIDRCGIDRNFRKGEKPSDHAPLLLQLV
jgi:exodeoxyribonuclease III